MLAELVAPSKKYGQGETDERQVQQYTHGPARQPCRIANDVNNL